jgi:hypothetical protein
VVLFATVRYIEAALRTREQIESILTAELNFALKRFNVARAEFNEVIADTPSGLPHPDGSLRVELASRGKQRAAEALQRALHRHNDFLLHGKVPSDLNPDPE